MLKQELTVPIENPTKLYNNAVKSKDIENRNVLHDLRKKVFDRYQDYFDNKNNLENITSSNILLSNEKDLLKGCYTRKSNNIVGKLTNEMIKSLNVPYVSNCPHCGFETPPDTIDHYLPKDTFPEFSILPINLIPMCWNCNNIKGESWREGNIRTCINLYFDEIFKYKVLYGELIRRRNTYIVSFSIRKDDEMLSEEYEIVKRHFITYSLRERYTKSSATIVAQIILKIRNSPLDIEKHKENLISDIESNNEIYGLNYWKSCIYSAILCSDNFWTSI